MNERLFPESIQYQVVLLNLEKNGGQLKCENCKRNITSKTECHFDHIIPFSKGGKTLLSNCQILCIECNQKKHDKGLHDFVLEEKAKSFLFDDGDINDTNLKADFQQKDKLNGKLSKKEVEAAIRNFVTKKGRIRKIDFAREKNQLPSFHWVNRYWGNITQMQRELGFPLGIPVWNRESIKLTVEKYIAIKGNVVQIDFKSRNGLPSIPCILHYYPELNNFSEIKEFFGLKRRFINWTHESAIQAGKTFISQTNGKLTQKDLKNINDLPGLKVINRLFGSLQRYRTIIGASETQKNDYISAEKIEIVVLEFFGDKERFVYNRKAFFRDFPYSQSTIIKRFETIDNFFKRYGIIESNPKKGRYTKSEIDQIILEYIKAGNTIPKTSKELTKNGLPSSFAIMRYYDSWREPFIFFQMIYEKIR